ncbi:MAG: S1C family serine protease [Ilumatobacteraceae bacterium]
MFQEIENTIRSVTDRIGPAVVAIGRNGRGTGFVVAPDRVLTSAHNLRDETVAITFADGRNEQGTVHGADVDGDVAVLAVPTGAATPVTFADTLPGIGAAVVAISRGGFRVRTTLGFVSATGQSFRGPRGRLVRGSIEHTAPLARGSSGGPVCDSSGAVVGINTHRVGDGLYLARAADDVMRRLVADLLAGRSRQRRTLGVALAPAEVAARLRESVGLDAREGLLVRAVDDDGPAAQAGVAKGDLMVAIDDRALHTIDDLVGALEVLTAETAQLSIVRGGDERTVTVIFGK